MEAGSRNFRLSGEAIGLMAASGKSRLAGGDAFAK